MNQQQEYYESEIEYLEDLVEELEAKVKKAENTTKLLISIVDEYVTDGTIYDAIAQEFEERQKND